MHFWKIDKLKEEIKNDDLSEKDKFIYAVIYIVSCAFGMEAMGWLNIEDQNIWDIVVSISNVIIVLVGTIFAFKANGGSTGEDFLGRFFSIGFIISVRFFVILIAIISITMVYIYYSTDENGYIETSPVDIFPYLIWYVALFWRICFHIKDVKNT